jgi:hypothetical protein
VLRTSLSFLIVRFGGRAQFETWITKLRKPRNQDQALAANIAQQMLFAESQNKAEVDST